jgi:putative membrane protein
MHTRIFSLLVGFLALGSIALPVQAQTNLSAQDKEFATKAASGGLMEVQLGQLAGKQAQAQEVKDFGAMMVKDHGKANDELKQIAQQKKLTLPTTLNPKHQKTVDKLKAAQGAEFDRQYMEEMVKDHVKDVEEFRKASQEVKDPDLNGWAKKTLPVLEQHLQEAKASAQKVGVDVAAAEMEARKKAQEKK